MGAARRKHCHCAIRRLPVYFVGTAVDQHVMPSAGAKGARGPPAKDRREDRRDGLTPPRPRPALTDIAPKPLTGLVLQRFGGARAAYQVGVLRAIAQLRRQALSLCARLNPVRRHHPGSAGAINAAALACHADRFEGRSRCWRVWQNFSAEQVYRADSLGVIRSGAQWLTMLSAGWVIARWRQAPAFAAGQRAAGGLLQRLVPLERLPMMTGGHLHALAVTASSYTTGEHYTFYNAAQPIDPGVRSAWRCPRR